MKYFVHLDEEQRTQLQQLIRVGKAPTRKITHARILLKADRHGEKLRDKAIAEHLSISIATVLRVRKRFTEEGLESALNHMHPQHLKPHVLDDRTEAHLIALACTREKGQARMSLRLLADKMVELGHAAHLSHETVRKTLKKTRSNRT